VVTRYAATRNAAVAGRCVAGDRSAAVDHCAEVGRYAAADHFVALVEIRAALDVARSVVPNVVRRSSWGDFRFVVPAVARVAVRVVVQIAAQVVIPEMTQA
jgi:hypothetical protein